MSAKTMCLDVNYNELKHFKILRLFCLILFWKIIQFSKCKFKLRTHEKFLQILRKNIKDEQKMKERYNEDSDENYGYYNHNNILSLWKVKLVDNQFQFWLRFSTFRIQICIKSIYTIKYIRRICGFCGFVPFLGDNFLITHHRNSLEVFYVIRSLYIL